MTARHFLELPVTFPVAPARVTEARLRVPQPDGRVVTVDVTRQVAALARTRGDYRFRVYAWNGDLKVTLRRSKRRFTDPLPFAIDGHAYRRRTRNRRKRR